MRIQILVAEPPALDRSDDPLLVYLGQQQTDRPIPLTHLHPNLIRTRGALFWRTASDDSTDAYKLPGHDGGHSRLNLPNLVVGNIQIAQRSAATSWSRLRDVFYSKPFTFSLIRRRPRIQGIEFIKRPGCTRSVTKSHARSLLLMARFKSASSRRRSASCRRKDRPDLLQFQWRLLSDELAFVPGFTTSVGNVWRFHG